MEINSNDCFPPIFYVITPNVRIPETVEGCQAEFTMRIQRIWWTTKWNPSDAKFGIFWMHVSFREGISPFEDDIYQKMEKLFKWWVSFELEKAEVYHPNLSIVTPSQGFRCFSRFFAGFFWPRKVGADRNRWNWKTPLKFMKSVFPHKNPSTPIPPNTIPGRKKRENKHPTWRIIPVSIAVSNRPHF